ncbi:phage protease [Sulfurimonas sp.]
MSKNIIVCGAGVVTSAAKWTPIAIVGAWKGHIAGEFELTLSDLEQIAINFKNADAEDVVVDFEHQSTENIKAEATGWAKDLKVEDNKLLAKIEWLEETKELIKSKKYKYLSPVLVQNSLDPITGDHIGWTLHSIALTNTPFFQELDEVILNKRQQEDDDSIQKKEKILDEELKKELEKLKEENAELLAENDKLKTEAAELKKTNAEVKVDEAVAAKKIHPDQKDSMLAFSAADPEGFEKFLTDAKAITSAPGGNDMFANSANGGQSNGNNNSDTGLSEDELNA